VAAPCPRVSRRNAVRRNVMGFILTDICALGGRGFGSWFFHFRFSPAAGSWSFFLRLCGVGFFSRASAGCLRGRISCAGIRDAPLRRGRCRCVVALCVGIRDALLRRGRCRCVVALCVGIRDALLRRGRCPCAGRHLLFFAAAKKSRQKKAAHTASPRSYPRAPNVPTLHAATFSFRSVADVFSFAPPPSPVRTAASRV
jgi:hypothetical protein